MISWLTFTHFYTLMKKTFFILLVAMVATSVRAQNKHNPSTLYPSYTGLVMAGYQGWFRAAGDGSAAKRYAFGDENSSSIDAWPDVTEYEKTYESPFSMPDGSKARFFSSLDKSTIDLHFKWMQEYNVDGVFMQRFFDATREGNRKKESSVILQNAMEAASKYKRAIAVMYDLSGLKAAGEDCSTIIDDWKYLVDEVKVTNQKGEKTYLFHRGKPLVVIWGVGFPDRPYNIRNIGLERLINFLKYDPVYGGCSVMLGVPTFLRDPQWGCVPLPFPHRPPCQGGLVMPLARPTLSPMLP